MTAPRFLRSIARPILVAVFCLACAADGDGAHGNVYEVTHDGLHLVEGSAVERAWIKPGENFTQYRRVGLLDCFVAFKKEWKLNHPNVSTHEMDRIKNRLAKEFHDVFAQVLEKHGYPIATAPADDVLLVRPALINLEVVAPETASSVDAITFTSSSGEMTLYVEFYDSVSNEILARAVDERAANDFGGVEESSIVTNKSDADRLLEHWADLLVKKLDAVHGKSSG